MVVLSNFNISGVFMTDCNVVVAAVDTPEVTVGDNLKISLNLNRQENAENDISYLVRDIFHLCSCACIVTHNQCSTVCMCVE